MININGDLMKNRKTIRRVVTISILIALSVIFSYVDNLISNGIFSGLRMIMPSFKMGLANLVIIIFIFRFNIKEGLVSIILKSLLVALMFSGVTGFMIGFPGTLLSFIVMKLLKNLLKEEKYIMFISAVGGISHSLGQIIAAFIIYDIVKIEAFIIYSPLIFIISIIAGLLVGIVGRKTIKILDAHQLLTN